MPSLDASKVKLNFELKVAFNGLVLCCTVATAMVAERALLF